MRMSHSSTAMAPGAFPQLCLPRRCMSTPVELEELSSCAAGAAAARHEGHAEPASSSNSREAVPESAMIC
jgi:hypothetical protein